MRNGSRGAPWAAGGKGKNFAELGVVNWGQPVAEETEVKPRPAFLGRGHARKVKLLPMPWKYQESSLQINWLDHRAADRPHLPHLPFDITAAI